MRPSVQALKQLYGNKPVTVLECGVLRGAHAIEMWKALNIKELYLLDQWREKWEHYHMPQIRDYAMEVFKYFDQMQNVFIIRGDALKFPGFHEAQFDFVYLDDNHKYLHVLAEMRRYYDTVKVGGILAGDNYTPGGQVEKAVKKFCADARCTYTWAERKKAAKSGVPVGDWWITC